MEINASQNILRKVCPSIWVSDTKANLYLRSSLKRASFAKTFKSVQKFQFLRSRKIHSSVSTKLIEKEIVVMRGKFQLAMLK